MRQGPQSRGCQKTHINTVLGLEASGRLTKRIEKGVRIENWMLSHKQNQLGLVEMQTFHHSCFQVSFKVLAQKQAYKIHLQKWILEPRRILQRHHHRLDLKSHNAKPEMRCCRSTSVYCSMAWMELSRPIPLIL